jgi:hypothetical protein
VLAAGQTFWFDWMLNDDMRFALRIGYRLSPVFGLLVEAASSVTETRMFDSVA